MVYRIPEFEVPLDLPFSNDVLNREPVVNMLADLIGRIETGPFVLAVNAPWGHGKTTFIRMLSATLVKRGFESVTFNAWKYDYVTDPLVAMVSVLEQIEPKTPQLAARFKSKMKRLRILTDHLAKRGVIIAVKSLTHGTVDLAEEIDLISGLGNDDTTVDAVEALQSEVAHLESFRKVLEDLVADSTEAEGSNPFIFFIDELDRCRPTFAISLLERVKHLFDVPNIIFVLSVDRPQLEAIVCSVYGSGINAPEYLRRFIDLEFGIPEPSSVRHTSYLLSKFKLDKLFRERLSNLAYEEGQFVEYFSRLADIAGLKLRAREQCITRLRVVLDQTPNNHYLEPVMVAFLIVLRTLNPKLFLQICSGELSPVDAVTFMKEFPGGQEFFEENMGMLLQAFLYTSDDDDVRREESYVNLRNTVDPFEGPAGAKARADRIWYLIQNFQPGRSYPSIRYIGSKIDLAVYVS